jgi:1-acyl-sn-glycerol-3-phosphate acyltransferase
MRSDHERGTGRPGARAGARPENRPIIRLFQALDVCYARIYHRLHVCAPPRLPRDGPGILVSNHTSGLDPLLIQSVCSRLIVWMVAQEYVERPVLNRIFRMIEAIPVGRDGRDMAATRQALRALDQGRILGVFPEGRIERTRQLLPFQTGVALMAMKTKVPVYPVLIDGTQRGLPMSKAFARRQQARITFGRPLRLHEDFSAKDLLGATFALQTAVRLLGEEPYGMPPNAAHSRLL